MTAPTWQQYMTEQMMQDSIRVAALQYGWKFYHTHNSRRSDAGYPDCVMIRDGVMLVYELKAQRGRVSPQQREWLAAFAGLGFNVRAAIVRPVPRDDSELSYDAALAMLAGQEAIR